MVAAHSSDTTVLKRSYGAVGVIFGDIGTSPLYALPAAILVTGTSPSTSMIYGIVSMIIWAIVLVVAVKYVWLISRADNDGEGGVMALLATLRQARPRPTLWITLSIVGIIGIALFYGDSVITPAISVLAAVEGLHQALPSIASYIVPIAVIVLTGLFVVQSRGTQAISRYFSPVMMVWFIVIAIAGIVAIVSAPDVLVALLPTTAWSLIVSQPATAFVLLGAVVLAITGSEALYADMGQFGRPAVERAWFLVVFPALICNYLGQAALFGSGHVSGIPFFSLFTGSLQLPIVILATLATLIASQAVISGAFSLTRQAVRLGYAPRMLVRYPSAEQGQVYLPALNWLLYGLVMVLVVAFGSSERLAEAFGMAVSGTLLVDSLLFVAVMLLVWKTKRYLIGVYALVFFTIDIAFIASNSVKFAHGGWVPILIALVAGAIMLTWTFGHRRLSQRRAHFEEKTAAFVEDIRRRHIRRIPGVAVYLAEHTASVPAGLRATIEQFHELPRTVLIVTVRTENIPHVARGNRMSVDSLAHIEDGIVRIVLHFGFNDIPNVPLALSHNEQAIPELHGSLETATYVVSNSKPIVEGRLSPRKLWRRLFMILERNARNPSDYFHLPSSRTMDMVTYIEI